MRSGTLETVEILDLRHYTSADLRPLLDREAEVWAERMIWDYRSSADMILRYIDSKILPGYTAIENGRVVGYSFFVYEGSKGVIGDIFVSANGSGPLVDSEHDSAVRSRFRLMLRKTSPPILLYLPMGSGLDWTRRKASSIRPSAPKKIGSVATASMVRMNRRMSIILFGSLFGPD